MHTAYRLHQLLKLPLTIESLLAYDDHLLVGTKQGHLLMYSVVLSNADAASSSSSSNGVGGNRTVELIRTNKFFSRKPIVQLAAVPEYCILVALTDAQISVHDLDRAVTSFPCIANVARTRGASGFALDVVRQRSLTGETAVTVKMVVAVKRRLQFYYYKNRNFLELRPDVALSDTPRSLAWNGDSVCVGFRGEYSLLKMQSQEGLCELFPTGKDQEARVLRLDDARFALGKDEQTTFIDLDGNMKLYTVNWGEAAKALAHDPPYLLGVLDQKIDVKTVEPRLSIQTLELARPRLICRARHGLVYAASATHVWCLQRTPATVQIPQLLRDKQFELAVTLANLSGDSLDDKTRRVQQIETLHAFDLFCSRKFADSMDVFFQLDIDTSHVIGLFADLLPQEFRNRLQYPDKPPALVGRELENAMLALVEYLTKVRHRLNGLAAKTISPLPIMEGCVTIESKRQMKQILDTTLLKCYLKTNDALVAPLLRLKDNQCHREETERALKRSQKFAELIIFYNTRRLHREALTLLKEHHNRPDSPLRSHLKTVHYLQNLGPQHVDLICEFAAWVFRVDEQDGLSIFTEDLGEVETLPRDKVLAFLLKTRPSTAIAYLKHIIVEWKETGSVFHNELILQYKEFIARRMAEDDVDSGAGDEALATARRELSELLLSSTSYSAELVLQQFPKDSFEEERALLLGSLRRHREALSLIVHKMGDVERALSYCQKHYMAAVADAAEAEPAPPGSDLYSTCFQLLVESPREAHREAALSLLSEHGDKVDVVLALQCMPADTSLSRLSDFLSSGLERRVSQRHHTQLLRGLMHAEHLQVQEERIRLQSQKVVVQELDVCPVCHKRFKNQGAFVRRTDGQVVHYSCSREKRTSPERLAN